MRKVSMNVSKMVFVGILSLPYFVLADPEVLPTEKPISRYRITFNELKRRPKSQVRAGAEIFAGSFAAACLYSIAQAQVSAWVCPEYFTEGFHKRSVEGWADGWMKEALLTTQSPAKLGLIWGVKYSKLMGAGLSVPIMISARAGSWPRLEMKDLIKPVGIALGAMGLYALGAGLRGYNLACKNEIGFWGGWADPITLKLMQQQPIKKYYDKRIVGDTPDESLNLFIAVSRAHRSIIQSGPLALIGLAGWILYKRYRLKKEKVAADCEKLKMRM